MREPSLHARSVAFVRLFQYHPRFVFLHLASVPMRASFARGHDALQSTGFQVDSRFERGE